MTIILTALLQIQCSNSSTDSQNNNPPDPVVNPGELTSAEKGLVEAGNKFGLKLFREIVANEPDTNIFISPLSISMALGMTCNGANGDTREAMKQTLELNGLTLDEINGSYLSLINALSELDPKVLFEIANSIWYREGIKVKDEFINLNKNYFNAEVASLDFSNDESCDIINGWVDSKTHGKILEIIDPPIDPYAIMFLINAIYFKGDWTYQFDSEYTRKLPFYLMNGSGGQCHMMMQQGFYQYYENERFQAIDLPYGDGDYCMTIFLPKTDAGENVNTLAAEFTEENWQNWIGSLSEEEVLISLPKFEIEYGIKLKNALSALGMGIAFDGELADFTNIADLELFINEVRHKTYVKVDEVGTEAAAVTIVEVFTTSTEPPSYKIMNADHPFLFVIRELNSNTILFMGKIINPGLPE